MLIATLPTAVSDESFRIAESIIKHRDIQAVRYNTGGDSPYAAKEILGKLKVIADHHRKILYVDLEGRQTRVAVWTPQSRGSVILNRQFEIQLPGMIYFRKAGWCEIVNADIKNSKLYFRSKQMPDEYFLGEGQSVHVVANKFIIKGCLGGRDHEFVKAAAELGIDQFMLSFVESFDDCLEVEELFATFTEPKHKPRLVLKIESLKGVELLRKYGSLIQNKYQLMAARDDLFLGFVRNRVEILPALNLIIEVDPEAIVASHLLTGLERGREATLGDMSDAVLMHNLGFRHFMFADELSEKIEIAAKVWCEQIVPNFSS